MEAAAAAETSFQIAHCTVNLTQIALLFCLRSCKYTKAQYHRRTVQFRFRDLQFHEENGIIPHNAPSKLFLHAQVVTLFLDTKNNCVREDYTTIKATDLEHGNTASSDACRFLQLQKNGADPDSPICT